MCNADLRSEAKIAGVRWWQIGESLNMSEPSVTRLLRHELPESQKTEIRKIIQQLSEQTGRG